MQIKILLFVLHKNSLFKTRVRLVENLCLRTKHKFHDFSTRKPRGFTCQCLLGYSSILAIVNRRNWLDDSPPLSCSACLNKAFFSFGIEIKLLLKSLTQNKLIGRLCRNSKKPHFCTKQLLQFLRIKFQSKA